MSGEIQNGFKIFISVAQKKYIIAVEQREISPLYHVYYDKGLPFTGSHPNDHPVKSPLTAAVAQ